MANWKTVLSSNQEVFGTIDIKRGIFQGVSLLPLLFVIIIPYVDKILRGFNFADDENLSTAKKILPYYRKLTRHEINYTAL